MRRLDRRGRVRFVDIGRSEAACALDRRALLARLHAQEGDGPIVSGAAAFAALWRAIPMLRPLGLLARNAVVLAALERLYRLFLQVRPRSAALRRLA